MTDEERQWRHARRTAAVALAMVKDTVRGRGTVSDKTRKVILFARLAAAEIDVAVAARGLMLGAALTEAR